MFRFPRPALTATLALALAACGTSFGTSYDAAVPPDVARDWRLADVIVTVPASLSVSEAKAIFPQADIVWREDPPGDRRAQVAALLDAAATAGASPLQGARPVNIYLTVTRFHALTFEAESRLRYSGVHDIEFNARVTDAATGEVLAGPEGIEASLPALSGVDMVQARARGETQRSQITAHVAATLRGWLGLGPDPRQQFRRLGG
ncbi:MAG: hypothetical protein RLZZ528_1677 [Pseudomonadota bacterium]